MRIIIATGNEGKLQEVRMILSDFSMEILSMKTAGIKVKINENGKTFAENALIKARSVSKLCKDDIVLADDSGLVVDALNGEPGIYSARYMGEETSYHIKNRNIIERLNNMPDKKRTARFVCAMAAVLPSGEEIVTEGVIEGLIGHEERGENGFGYDPIFYVSEYHCTTGEMAAEQKNKISHRSRALEKMKQELRVRFQNGEY